MTKNKTQICKTCTLELDYNGEKIKPKDALRECDICGKVISTKYSLCNNCSQGKSKCKVCGEDIER